MKYDLTKFPERLKEAREAKGMTKRDLESVSGVANQSLSKYELGQVQPKGEFLSYIATALDVSIDWLLGGYE